MISNYILEFAPFICGLLFTIGALVISETGRIFIGSIIYLCADLVYLVYAITMGDTFGMISLALGLIFGIRTLIKMNIGIFHKNININKN